MKKKWIQLILVAAIALILGLATKAESQAAAITGLKQTDAGTSNVSVSCDTDLSAKYYVLYISTDQKNWVEKANSTNPNSLYASGLSAGSTYYACVRGATGYESSETGKVWTWCTDTSAALEVVTTPSATDCKAVQTNATLNSVSIQISGATGANYYVITSGWPYSTSTIYAQSASATMTIPQTTGTDRRLYVYACRRSASGFIAHDRYNDTSVYAKTLINKLNKNNFGITNTYSSINVYYFGVSSNLVADGWQLQFQTIKGKTKKDVYSSINSSARMENFVNGTFYRYRVRTYVTCGTSRAYSAWSDFQYVGVPKKASATCKTTGKAKKRSIVCSWGSVSGANQYVVYISKSENSGYKKVKTLTSKKRRLVITKFGKKS